MSRTRGDGKRVVTKQGDNFDVNVLPERARVARHLNGRLSDALWRDLFKVTFAYACYRGSDRSTRTAKRVKATIELWRRKTTVLRNQIWALNSQPHESLSRESVIQRYFQGSIPNVYPMQLLAHALDAAVATGDAVNRELSDPQYHGVRDSQLWTLWLAVLIQCLRHHGLPVAHVDDSGKRRLESGVVAFIAEMQKKMPLHLKHRRTPSSLKKGILDALKVADTFHSGELLNLLIVWGFDFDYESQKFTDDEMKSLAWLKDLSARYDADRLARGARKAGTRTFPKSTK
jgi:hypothetical protein